MTSRNTKKNMRRPNRRDFLKQAVGAFAVPWIVPSLRSPWQLSS